MTLMKVMIHFDHSLRQWDGFGFNYVETAQTQNYAKEPQDYGGFSIIDESHRQEILYLVFGEDGLKPGLVKMFYDPWHQPESEAPGDRSLEIEMSRFDHQTSTHWLRYFARQGLQITRQRRQDLQFITTLYGPPGWMTRQRILRGRDLDPDYTFACIRYMISWVKYLKETEGIPVRYISVHNEGEDYLRWREDGTSDWGGHDYNLYWSPEQVCEFLRLGRIVLEANGLGNVAFTPGETTNWLRFYEWGYADAIARDPEALANMGLITSHGFTSLQLGRWFSDWRSAGIDLLREKRPELHAWVTSTSWSKMDVFMLMEMRNNIYSAKVNGIIPWAGIQRSSLWKKGDPNPGTAIRINEDGSYIVEPGYYYYKQICRAGQPGMTVAPAFSNDTEVIPLAFGTGSSEHRQAFVLLNISGETKRPNVFLTGTNSAVYEVYRTSATEQYAALGSVANSGVMSVELPPLSVTTFFGK
jgi:O-glycosyl hydrolase